MRNLNEQGLWHFTVLLAAIALALGAQGETRISYPSLGPIGEFTSDLRVVRRANDDVAVWYSQGSVWASTVDSSALPSLATPLGNVTENRVPDVVTDGDDAIVFWTERGRLFQRRLAADGTTPDPARLVISGVDSPRAARSGATTAVVCDPYLIDATFIGSVLHVLDANGAVARRVLVTESQGARLEAWSGGFVSAFRTNDEIELRRISESGDFLDAAPLRAGDPASLWDFAAHGSRAWIVRRMSSNAGYVEVVAFASDGTIAVQKTFSWPELGSTITGITIDADAEGLVALIELGEDIYRMQLANDGTEREPLTAAIVRPGRQLARAVSAGPRPLEFWSDGWVTDILVQRSDADDARFLTIGGTRATGHSIAASPSAMLVAWHEDSGGAQIYYYRVLDQAGVPIGEPVELDRGIAYNFDPTVVWNGSEFGVLWYANGRTRLMRFGGDGTPLEAAIDLAGVPREARLFGGHSRLVAAWTQYEFDNPFSIRAHVVGASGAGPLLSLTTPIPPPPDAASHDSTPILVPVSTGWQLFYENTIEWGCVGIPCPYETSVYVSHHPVELAGSSSAPKLLASDATLAGAASNGGAAAALVEKIDLYLHAIPSSDAKPVVTRVRERTGWLPWLATAAITAHDDGFALLVAENLQDENWVSIRETGPDGSQRRLRVLDIAPIDQPRLASTASDDIVLFRRRILEEYGGVSLFTESWRHAPDGPLPPSTPTSVVARKLAPPFVELRWEYSGPPVRGFSITSAPYDTPTIVGPDERSVTVSTNRSEYRVVAFNEAGSASSDRVVPESKRTRGARR